MADSELFNLEENSFKAITYLGSKLRILDFIEDAVDSISGAQEKVCDLFAGGGSVTYRLSRTRGVVSSDIQEYSRVICSALTSNADRTSVNLRNEKGRLQTPFYDKLILLFEPLIQLEEAAIKDRNIQTIADIIDYGSIRIFQEEKKDGPIVNQLQSVVDGINREGISMIQSRISCFYGGVYFSYKQAVEIDSIFYAISSINDEFKDIRMAALLGAVSESVNTVGKQFAQPLKLRDSSGQLKVKSSEKVTRERSLSVTELYLEKLEEYLHLTPGYPAVIIRGDYMDTLRGLEQDVTTIYADPPYTRDHYSRYYHILETIALGDIPALSKTKIHGDEHISRGIYREDRHQSPFCIKKQAPLAFDAMFAEVAKTNRKLLLSYSPYDSSKKTHPRVVTIEQLQLLAQRYFRNVDAISPGHFSHSKLNSTEHSLEASDTAELLLVCQN